MANNPLTADQFFHMFHVSRETQEKFETYLGLLNKWQKAINLVGGSTLKDPWRRHFLDSAQVLSFIEGSEAQSSRANKCQIVDLGAGAGFPGLVLSMLGCEKLGLIESDLRKCIFMQEVMRSCGLSAEVINKRIEQVDDLKADVVTSRALAEIDVLLDLSQGLATDKTEYIFLKGGRADEEIKAAEKNWSFDLQKKDSLSDPNGVVLKLTNVRKN